MRTLFILAMLVAPLSVEAANAHDPHGPRGRGWEAQCRVVLETIFGRDLQDFWGYGFGRHRFDALREARQEGRVQCEYARRGRPLTKCTVDEGKCRAHRARRHRHDH